MNRQDSFQYPLDGYAKSAKKINNNSSPRFMRGTRPHVRFVPLRYQFPFFLGALAVKKVFL